jgi:hypothetical protein
MQLIQRLEFEGFLILMTSVRKDAVQPKICTIQNLNIHIPRRAPARRIRYSTE